MTPAQNETLLWLGRAEKHRDELKGIARCLDNHPGVLKAVREAVAELEKDIDSLVRSGYRIGALVRTT